MPLRTRSASACAGLLLLGACTAPPPHVLMISLDTVRADALTESPAATELPALARLRREGSTFTSAQAPIPFTLASHLTLLTGASPLVHRVKHRQRRLSERIPTLAERLRDAGYRTVGVYSSDLLGPQFGFARGFDRWVVQGGDAAAIRARAESLLVDALASERPVFLFAHFYDAHSDPHSASNRLPYDAPSAYRRELPAIDPAAFCDPRDRCATDLLLAANREGRALPEPTREWLRPLYLSGVRYLEAEVDLLLRAFVARGVWDDALIIVTADHGEELGEHGMYLHAQLFEEVSRVPLLVRFPRGRQGRQRVGEPVDLADIVPTVLEVAGVDPEPADPWMSGRSLAPGRDGATPRLLLGQETLRYRRFTARQGRYKLHFEHQGAILGLYDLEADPGERTDLSGRLGELARSLEEQAEARILAEHRLSKVFGGPEIGAGEPALADEAVERLRALGYVH